MRQRIASALTAKHMLIKVETSGGPTFVEAGTGSVENLGPGQAGNGVLTSQTNDIVFYEILVNDVYAWYLTGRKTSNGGIPPYFGSRPPYDYGLFPTLSTDLTAIAA